MDKKWLSLIIFLIFIVMICPISAENNVTNVSVDEAYCSQHINLESMHIENVKEIVIDDKNYNQYFEPYSGYILDYADINDGDILKISSVTNKIFVIDRCLTITSANNGDVIHNGYVKLIKGSSGSIIHDLTIKNDKLNYVLNGISSPDLNGIGIFYSDNNTIYNNYVKLANGRGVFALPMGATSNNKIFNNTFISTVSTCVPMADTHNCLFYNNYFQSSAANVIYYNPFGHAGYGGSTSCINNSFIGNTIKSLSKNSEWAMGMVLNSAVPVTIINNTIIDVFIGISDLGMGIVYGNTLINNTNTAISINGNITVHNNTIVNSSIAFLTSSKSTIGDNSINNVLVGVWARVDNVNVINNKFDIIDSYYAIFAEKDNCTISNNYIRIRNFGEGIRTIGKNTKIVNNEIVTSIDTAIYCSSSNNTIINNKISSTNYGIHIDANNEIKYTLNSGSIIKFFTYNSGKIYDNYISDNFISSNKFGVYVEGTVYSTTIVNNKITTFADLGILVDVTDPNFDNITNNIINGIYVNYSGIILSDSNFHIYFDEDGTFKFKDSGREFKFLITFLTNKTMIISSKITLVNGGIMNRLINVNIEFIEGSGGSIVDGLIFKNNDVVPISINNVNNITVKNLDISLKGVNIEGFLINNSESISLESNGVYIFSLDGNLNGLLINNSNNIVILNNVLILEGYGSINGFFVDNLVNSNIINNTLHIYGNANYNGVLINNSNNLLFENNNYLGSSNKESKSLIIGKSNDILINSPYIDNLADTIGSISFINSSNISINDGFIKLVSRNNKNKYSIESLGCNLIIINNSTLYSNALNVANAKDALNLTNIKHVVYDDNIETYFVKNIFSKDILNKGDSLLFDNIKLNHYDLVFDSLVNISSYSKNSEVDVSLIFNSKAVNSTISGLNFNLINNSAVILNSVSNITVLDSRIVISNSRFIDGSAIKILGNSQNNKIINNNFILNGGNKIVGVLIYNFYDGYYGLSPINNQIISNSFNIVSNNISIGIYNSMSDKTQIKDNNIFISGINVYGIYNDYLPEYKVFMSTIITSNTNICDNDLNGTGENVYMIYQRGSRNSVIEANKLFAVGNVTYGIYFNQTVGDNLKYNDILVNGLINKDIPLTAVYISNNTNNIVLRENNIASNYISGGDYALYVERGTSGIYVVDNYLISNNDSWKGNSAIYAPTAKLENNALFDVYVSENGSDMMGDGTQNNPFATIKHALQSVINKGVVYVLPGKYDENNITISKYVSLQGLGDVVINLNGQSLFEITKTGVFDVSNIVFTNGSSINGSVFFNNGNLKLVNITISNCSSHNGGGIYNNYYLTIDNSTFYSNNGINGGVIFNNRYLVITNSTFENNKVTSNSQGGAVYSTSKGNLQVLNSKFYKNSANSGSGGALFSQGELIVDNTLFDSNYVKNHGGAIYAISLKNQLCKVSNCSFTNQSGSGYGGGMYIQGMNLNLSKNVFYDNHVAGDGMGGALYIKDSSGKIHNCSFIKNTAGWYGGAICMLQSNIVMTLINMSENAADVGGAVFVRGSTSGSHNVNKLEIYNSSITNNYGLNQAGGITIDNSDAKIQYCNIYDNYGGDILKDTYASNIPNYDVFDFNYNWWGSDAGPDDRIWQDAKYFREWSKTAYVWSTQTDSSSTNNGNSGNTIIFGNTRPGGFSQVTTVSTGSGLGQGSGHGFGTGFGNGFGSGFGNGHSSSNSGSSSNGGSFGSGDGYIGIAGNNVGTIGNIGAASNFGSSSSAGSSSVGDSGKSYELSKKNVNKIIDKDKAYFGVILVFIILILLSIGYLHKKGGVN